MEYFCPLCREWLDSAYCVGHFESVHGNKGMTFDKVKERYAWIGGLDTRDEAPVVEEKNEKRFVTNNFTHVME